MQCQVAWPWLHFTTALTSPNPFVSLIQATMNERIWECLSANEGRIPPAVILAKSLLVSRAPQQNGILSSVEPVSNHHQHHLWYCSHSHKHHHNLAESSGLAAMARALLPAADRASRSFPLRTFNCERRYSYGIQTSSLAQHPLSRHARVMKSLEMGILKIILFAEHQRRKRQTLAMSLHIL